MIEAQKNIKKFLRSKNYSSIVFIIDEKVHQLYPLFTEPFASDHTFTYLIKGTEQNKSLKTCSLLWDFMLQNDIDKDALIINVGGGIISDIGGFVAANYKRGIDFINIPTTFLSMIDAAVGGKNGVNHGTVKNSIGSICFPKQVIIDTSFLMTLPVKELKNGFGELIKYALIGVPGLWEDIKGMPQFDGLESEWIGMAVNFKEEIVEQDIEDKKERRVLNFGHTIGHALEAYYLKNKKSFSHGHAVALGLCCETYISYLHQKISLEEAQFIKQYILRFFSLPSLPENDYAVIYDFVRKDKKNDTTGINITLLKKIGKAIPNQKIGEKEIIESLRFLWS